MQSLLTFLLQLSGKAWAAVVMAVLSGGALTVFYFSSAPGASPSTGGAPPACVPGGPASDLNRGGGLGCHPGPVSAVPDEANTGLLLAPVVAAMLAFSTRRLRPARTSLAADGQIR